MNRYKILLIVGMFLISIVVLVDRPFEKAAASPVFQIPFPPGQAWIGQTRMNHNPQNAVDLNRLYDEGDEVIASAPGKVVKVRNLGNRSYGKYVVISHGGRWETLYAHLSNVQVKIGQQVRRGERIGAVGSSGASTGAHLHYEQRYNGKAQQIRWKGRSIFYWGSRTYRS
ncbi:M23 family metallopeptidase [Fictibacillus fluitans]|uniref:M23 family metallopeptidase n=1 Tax=Fictibacillus fluitans TaxID=3058422 RepID=A0ABT8HVP8_9BACL|nr:M23 family metallopeptidase [Fictibacillus sp. NE201]MDN4524857.1 M23 family metallopeptidase [Fictibacillus sp. NE201]